MLADDTVVRRLDGLVEAEVDDEIVALHVDQGLCYGFNVTATSVWNALREPRSMAELKHALLAEFEVDPDTCGRELGEIIETMAAQGLVTTTAA